MLDKKIRVPKNEAAENKIRKDKAAESTFGTSAYGGAGWVQREKSHGNELGNLWAPYRIDSEWRALQAVIVHEPGAELAAAVDDPGSVLMLEPLDLTRAAEQHVNMVEAYRSLGIE